MASPNTSDRFAALGGPTPPERGLTAQQVQLSRQQYGSNVLTPPPKKPWWKLYLEKFADPVIRILTIAAAIALAVGRVKGEYLEGLGIIIAIFLATTLAFLNEYRASREFELLARVSDRVGVKVRREGRVMAIPRQELVVGDITYIAQGDEVPADGEVLEAISLYLDQAKLTGESEPAKKWAAGAAPVRGQADVAYSPHHVYRSTLVVQGNGCLRVTAVGDGTEIGQLARAVTAIETADITPLKRQLQKLSQLIGLVGLSVSALTFFSLLVRGFWLGQLSLSLQQSYVAGLLIISVITVLIPVWLPIVVGGWQLFGLNPKLPGILAENNLSTWLVAGAAGLGLGLVGLAIGYPLALIPAGGESWLPYRVGRILLNYFMVAVTIIVVAVPEGLAMSVTLSLAYSMKKMAAANSLVRRMHACETIGAATVICSDKTGTLTQNLMQVQSLNFPCLDYADNPQFSYYHKLIAEAIAANSTADLEKKPLQPPQPLGNVTEGALLLWLDSQEIDYLACRHRFATSWQEAFSADKKYMATAGKSAVTGGDILYLKGAPEVLLPRCSHLLGEQGLVPLADSEALFYRIQTVQSQGMRTLAFACRSVPPHFSPSDLEAIDSYLTWLGFVGICDPLRPEVPAAIQACLSAGIEVKVVTGDSPQTAQEIARQIGLLPRATAASPHPYAHLTGQEFQQLSDSEGREAVKFLKILSRAYPLDKLRLVRLLQENGAVVGVTGDGTNDAAALKQAQVGLAMGSGTAIAKEASDIILLDDSFQSIVNAVVWGRSLYDNIQRFLLFQLTINVVALGIALAGPLIGIALPLTVTQMLWVNLIMDTFAALALAAEPPHWAVMERPPRQPEAFIISPAMAEEILGGGLAFLLFLVGFLRFLHGDGEVSDYELSVFFAVFVLLQFWNLFNARCWGLKQSALAGLDKNPAFVVIAGTILLGQILLVQWGGSVFRTVPLSFQDWCVIGAGTSAVLWLGEIRRASRRLCLKI